jgi:hypothetical protein
MAALRADARLSSPPPGRFPMGGLVDITDWPGVPGSANAKHPQNDQLARQNVTLVAQFID